VFMAGIATVAGWRSAALGATLVALLALGLLYWRRQAIADPVGYHANQHGQNSGPAFAFLSSRAVWLCFLFFLLITAAFGVIQNFASPILQALYSLSITAAAAALSTYLLGGAAG